MIDFANSNELWSACNRQLNEDVVGVHRKTPSQCVRQAGLTNLAVTNTYVDDTISNGAEISSGLRGTKIGTVLRLTLIRPRVKSINRCVARVGLVRLA
jgi:hypothetical protein